MGHYIYISEPGGRKRWRICEARLPQNQHETNWGDCDYGKRVVTIHKPLSAEERLRTIIHEAAHAAAPDLSESVICRIEESAANALLPYLPGISDEME